MRTQFERRSGAQAQAKPILPQEPALRGILGHAQRRLGVLTAAQKSEGSRVRRDQAGRRVRDIGPLRPRGPRDRQGVRPEERGEGEDHRRDRLLPRLHAHAVVGGRERPARPRVAGGEAASGGGAGDGADHAHVGRAVHVLVRETGLRVLGALEFRDEPSPSE